MWKYYVLSFALALPSFLTFAQDEANFTSTYEDKQNMIYVQPAVYFTGFLNLGYERWNSKSTTSFSIHGAQNFSLKNAAATAEFKIHPSSWSWQKDWPLSFTTIEDVNTGIVFGPTVTSNFDAGSVANVTAGALAGVEVHFKPGILFRFVWYAEYIHDVIIEASTTKNSKFTPKINLGYRF